jgi:Zinc-binding domain of primase-helicase
MNVSPNENQRLRTIAYFDQIMFAASASDFTGESRLNPTDRIVALGILQYVNREAGATYVDRLTLAKRLDIKHPAVMTATRRLAERGDLKITERPGKTPLLSPIPKECSEHSQRGDKAFYAARGKVIKQLVFDQRLTPAERLAGLAFLALVDADTFECDASQYHVAQACGLSRDLLYKRALPKLEALGYIARKSGAIVFDLAIEVEAEVSPEVSPEVSERGKARQMGVSERNHRDSSNPQDSVSIPVVNDSMSSSIGRTSETAHGRWREILPVLGVPIAALNGKHQACPACGGKDRFRFDDRHGDGDYLCNQCGAGKGISLLMKVNGWSYADAAKRVDELIGKVPPKAVRNAPASAKPDTLVIKFPDAAAVELWRRSVYRFLVEGGPIGMLHDREMATLVEAGFVTRHGERVAITPKGHRLGSAATSPQEHAA